MLFLLGLEPQDKVQFATPKLSKHHPSKAMSSYFLIFKPQFLLRNLPSQRVHEKELWMSKVPTAGSPARCQDPGARSGDIFSYKMGRLAGSRRGLVSLRKRGWERHYGWLQACSQPLVRCPGVGCYPSRCRLLYPSTSSAMWKPFNSVFSEYTPLLRVWTRLCTDAHTYSAPAENSEFLIQKEENAVIYVISQKLLKSAVTVQSRKQKLTN